MRRWKLLGVMAAGLVALIALAAIVLWRQTNPGSQITRQNFDRIHKGMTRPEVETIVGPSGSYLADKRIFCIEAPDPSRWPPVGMTAVEWTNDVRHGLVLFNANETVAEVYFSSFAPDGDLEYFLWRISRLWRRR
jgi:hypothetical protein